MWPFVQSMGCRTAPNLCSANKLPTRKFGAKAGTLSLSSKVEDQDLKAATLYADTLKMISDDGDFERLCQKLFVFSPFEALGVADSEIRHGNFLAHLFNPSAPHGFGDAVLVTFLKQLLGGHVAPEKLAHILIKGVGPVLVHREWHGIDILIELNDPKLKLLIVVELKLHAKESAGQLKKYTDFIEGRSEYKGFSKQYVFMTPDGAVASHDGWRDFNMTAGFINALKQLTQSDNGHETARALLTDYVRIMEQKFMTEKELDDLAEILWARYPDVLKFLADNRPDLISKIFDHLYYAKSETLYERLKGLGFDFTQEWTHETNSRLIYTFENWDKVDGMCTSTDRRSKESQRLMWFVLEKSRSGICALFMIGPGDQKSRKKILEALIASDANTGSQKDADRMADEHSRLGSVWLFRYDPEQHTFEDFEKLAAKAVSELERFLTDQLPKIDAGFAQLKSTDLH